MIDLTKSWPLGLNRRNWWQFTLFFIALIAGLYLIDILASRGAQAFPAQVVAFFAWLTEWGESDWILIPTLAFTVLCGLLALAIPKRIPKLALLQMTQLFGFIFIGVGLPGLVAALLKRIIGRGRPELYDSIGSLGFQNIFNAYPYQSFPSGHATTALGMAFVVGFLSPRWFPAFLAFGLGIAASRVIVGAHYPTDVLAGMVLGTLGAYLVRNFFASRRWVFEFTPSGNVRPRNLSAVRRLIRGNKRKTVSGPRDSAPVLPTDRP
jgi:undecaprenyl-diphosphatase